MMEPIPLPAYVHDELLLQFLEQKTRFAVQRNSPQYEKIDQLIITPPEFKQLSIFDLLK
ncbi:hypothetical protein PL8927_260007 [Planktothrix serta PCC 8927]|uniref:Uncharacterized protein n=2 Tax=Planktothrix TaxID=54304 RepID=A0A7Z9BJF8_9CYAN|nr:hypothetical protein PL8927_260007 [Planktothrix serta PCC 8927]